MVLLMLIIGILSTIERILLAVLQHRNGPYSTFPSGVSVSIADGVKLYAKNDTDVGNRNVSVIYLSQLFATSVLCLYSITLSSGITADSSANVVLTVAITGSFAVMLLLPLVSLCDSKYTSVGILRILYTGLIAEILFSFMLVSMIPLSGLSYVDSFSSDCLRSHTVDAPIVFSTLALPAVAMLAGKMPYDFAESESELVSGVSTELSSVSFSLLFLAESSE